MWTIVKFRNCALLYRYTMAINHRLSLLISLILGHNHWHIKKKDNPTIKREKCRVLHFNNRKPLTHNVIRPPLNSGAARVATFSSDRGHVENHKKRSLSINLCTSDISIHPATIYLLKRHFTCSHTSLFLCFHAAFAYLHLFSSSVAVHTEWK